MTSPGIKIAICMSVSAFSLSLMFQVADGAVFGAGVLDFFQREARTQLGALLTHTEHVETLRTPAIEQQEIQKVTVSPKSVSQERDALDDVQLPVFVEQQCPFTAQGNDVVIDLSKTGKTNTYIAEGHYVAELAGQRRQTQTRNNKQLYHGWYLSLTQQDGEQSSTSGVARNIYNDERLVIELVEGVLAIEGGDYLVQAQYEHEAQSSTVRPLCALLRYKTPDPNVFPVTQTRLLSDTETFDAFKEEMRIDFDEMKESFNEEATSARDDFEEKKIEFDSDLFKPSSSTVSDIATNSPAVSTQERYTTGTDDQIYVEVSTYSVGVADGDSTVSVHKSFADRRRTLLEAFDDEPLFELFQERQEYIRNKELPDLIAAREDIFGNIEERVDLTRKSIEEDIVHLKSVHTDTREALEVFRYNKKDEFEDGTDTDGDGVTDYDERFIYQSDPNNPFTSGSVLSDGERVLLGLDPNRSDYTVLPVESAKRNTDAVQDLFHIQSIDYTTTREHEKAIKIEGTTVPYSFVTIYVYSTPVIVTVRSDENGSFTYTLEQTLEDGSHELYVATVNGTGKILAQSSAQTFIKTADAITYTSASVSNIKGPVDNALQKLVVISLLVTLLCAIGITVAIGYMKGKHHQEDVAETREYEDRTD